MISWHPQSRSHVEGRTTGRTDQKGSGGERKVWRPSPIKWPFEHLSYASFGDQQLRGLRRPAGQFRWRSGIPADQQLVDRIGRQPRRIVGAFASQRYGHDSLRALLQDAPALPNKAKARSIKRLSGPGTRVCDCWKRQSDRRTAMTFTFLRTAVAWRKTMNSVCHAFRRPRSGRLSSSTPEQK
jgi:hypothetical protein